MINIRQGSIRLFRFSGIDVFLHWSWFLIALIEIQSGAARYSSIAWNALEYLALFVIVTIHEFGHALACRQVGGTANQIVLWPLGGVAYVNPPPRPGATLWSIAAGPLVNVALLPILYVFDVWSGSSGLTAVAPDAHKLLQMLLYIDFGLLAFNMLPIYPLDGGQILRSLLWFVVGRARSLMVATVIGFAGVAGLIGLAVLWRSPWIGIVSVFILMNCWTGLRQGIALSRMAKLPRREGLACPSCKAAPLAGPNWICGKCRKPFDIFETQGVCPSCASRFSATKCLDCGAMNPISEWLAPTRVPSPL
ncbi:MAG: M50 family metallopeptidase [Candidatus Acidoferrales bacterium]|nr:M50 family metallopeptidase [Candidatus Acidoferrales bacterium]